MDLFRHLCGKAVRVKPAYADKQWSDLLADLLTLRGLVFPFISLESTYTQCVESMMAAGRFKLAKRMLRELTGLERKDEPRQKGGADAPKKASTLPAVAATFAPSLTASIQHVGLLPLPVAEELVLQEARKFLDSSASVDHPSIEQAKQCLHILPLQVQTDSLLPVFLTSTFSRTTSLSSPDLTSQWQQDLDFIEGLSQLSALHVSIIPYQLRTSSSRLSFISHLLAHNPQAYKGDQEVMDIARLFGCTSDESQAEGRLLLLRAAIADGDVGKAVELALGLLEERRYKEACGSALEVAQMAGIEEIRGAQKRLINNAVWACDIDQLDRVLEDWKTASIKPLDIPAFLSHWEEEGQTREARMKDGEEKGKEDVEMEDEKGVDTGTEVDRLIVSVVQQAGPSQPPPSRPNLLAYSIHYQSNDSATTDALLLAQVEATYQTNAALALSYLLALSSPLSADVLIKGMMAGPLTHPSRVTLVSLAFRYFALLSLAAPHPFRLPEGMVVVFSDHQLLDVNEDLLHQQVDNIAQLYQQSPSPVPDVVSRAVYYGGLRNEAQKAKEVLSQFPGLDLTRFTRDAEYRQSTILSLVQSPNAEQVAIALPLATRYGLSTTSVYIERLKWLMRSSSLQAMKDEVQGWTVQLMMAPRETYAVLEEAFPVIDGQLLDRFHFLIVLGERCWHAFDSINKTVASSPRRAALDLSVRLAQQQLTTHQQVLDRLMRAHLTLDYHRLLDKEQVADVLYEVVEEQNLALLERLASRLNELIAAPTSLPPLPAVPHPSSPRGSPSPTSPARKTPTYVTASLISRQFLSKSLATSLTSPAFSPSDWFERHGKRFQGLSMVDACQLLVQAASVERVPPPITIERLMSHLTLLDLGLVSLPPVKAEEDPIDVDRAYDAVIGLHERLSVLAAATQLPSIAATPYFLQLCQKQQWRGVVESMMLDGGAAGVQAKDIRELIDILEDQRAQHGPRYRQPLPLLMPWSVDSLASELFDEAFSRLLKVEEAPSIEVAIPSLAVLASPVGLCSLYLQDREKSAVVRHLRILLVSYWADALPQRGRKEGKSSLTFALLVKALTGNGHASMPSALRDSIRQVSAALNEDITQLHAQTLDRLLRTAETATREANGVEVTPAHMTAVERLLSLTPLAVPSPALFFASSNACALLAATWESDSNTTAAQWRALASVVS